MAEAKEYAVKHSFWHGDVYYTRQNESLVADLPAAAIKAHVEAGNIQDTSKPAVEPVASAEPKGRNR